MVAYVNEVRLMGHLGAAPEVRYTPGGTAVTTLSMATKKVRKDKATKAKIESTEWHRVVVWGKNAEFAGEYLGKGSYVYVTGELQTREWEKEGVKRYTTEVHGFVHALESKGGPTAPTGTPPEDLPPASSEYDEPADPNLIPF